MIGHLNYSQDFKLDWIAGQRFNQEVFPKEFLRLSHYKFSRMLSKCAGVRESRVELDKRRFELGVANFLHGYLC